MKVVVLCGGFGRRLWPLSTPKRPKQFLKLFKNASLFQKTINRNLQIADEFIIVVNQDQLSICKEQIQGIEAEFSFIVEPISKSTAPAIILAALDNPNQNLLVVPSDHIITNEAAYLESIDEAKRLANSKKIAIFGITPTEVNTNYGYIELPQEIKTRSCEVKSFVEKPNKTTATLYFESRNYLWNSGMFLFNSNVFIKEMKLHSTPLYNSVQNIYDKRITNQNIVRFNQILFSKLKSISIDYALIEKSNSVYVVISKFNWSDLGTFKTLYSNLYRYEQDLFDFHKTKSSKRVIYSISE